MDSANRRDRRTAEGVEWFFKEMHIKLTHTLRSAIRQRPTNGGDHTTGDMAAAQDSGREEATRCTQEVL